MVPPVLQRKRRRLSDGAQSDRLAPSATDATRRRVSASSRNRTAIGMIARGFRWTAAMTKRKRTKEKKRKAQRPQQLATPDKTSIGRRFAQPYGKAWLLIDHSHS